MPSHTDQQPLAVCTLPRSADKRARAQTRGQDVRLRRQAGKSWRRSKRQSAFYLQGCPTTHIAGRADTHPDALPPGSEGASPSRPCEPMVDTTIIICFSSLCAVLVSPARGGRSHQSQSIDCTNPLDHTNTCAHVKLEVKIGQNEYIVSLSLADSRSLTKFWGIQMYRTKDMLS